jgi:membrane protein involved in D-alanine export
MGYSLLSPEFLCLAVAAIVLVPLLAGLPRQAAFLAINLAFVYTVLGPAGFAVTVGFCGLGYVLIGLHRARPRLDPLVTLPILVLVFAYLRNYEMLRPVIPQSLAAALPQMIGLSFILFRIIHILVDLRGGAIGMPGPLAYLNYVLALTTFAMGPIQRLQDFRDQWAGLHAAIPLTFEAHLDAGLRVLFGLVKVYVLGAALEGIALQPGADVASLSIPALAGALYGFYFYLYFNFSGYCDVVIGIGSLMGVRPPENFNLPFLARNIGDFWQRQHRSLTDWLTAYVFTPSYKWALGTATLSARPLVAGIFAIMLTMLVSGLWHGTSIGFLLFGLAHGLYLAIYRVWDHLLVARLGRRRVRAIRATWPARLIGIALTFNAAAFAFLFFRLGTPQLVSLVHRVVSG